MEVCNTLYKNYFLFLFKLIVIDKCTCTMRPHDCVYHDAAQFENTIPFSERAGNLALQTYCNIVRGIKCFPCLSVWRLCWNFIIEPPHEKTNNFHRRKQSRRSAVQLFSLHG